MRQPLCSMCAMKTRAALGFWSTGHHWKSVGTITLLVGTWMWAVKAPQFWQTVCLGAHPNLLEMTRLRTKRMEV